MALKGRLALPVLPTLMGTQKQVEYAQDIRANALAIMEAHGRVEACKAIYTHPVLTSAAWWIEYGRVAEQFRVMLEARITLAQYCADHAISHPKTRVVQVEDASDYRLKILAQRRQKAFDEGGQYAEEHLEAERLMLQWEDARVWINRVFDASQSLAEIKDLCATLTAELQAAI